VAFDEELVRLGAHDVGQAELSTRELLRLPDPPTALFTANNRVSIGALRALRTAAARVALVGFDDFELADMLPVPVTVVSTTPPRWAGAARSSSSPASTATASRPGRSSSRRNWWCGAPASCRHRPYAPTVRFTGPHACLAPCRGWMMALSP
jgi:LacI family transcriptional regulator